jgi:hypothetical protein
MIKIHDIKPIVTIPDISIYLYYLSICLSLLFILTIIFFVYKFMKPKSKSKEYEYYKNLQNIDFNHVKQSAYDISKYGKLLAKESRQIQLIDDLCDELSLYKYKKEIPRDFDKKIKTKFSLFMESIHV